MSKILHYYRETEPSHSLLPSIKEQLKSIGLSSDAELLTSVQTESCFNVQIEGRDGLNKEETQRLEWLLAETFERSKLRLEKSAFEDSKTNVLSVEFGPRMTFTSAFSSNAVSICQACALTSITRLERSKRFCFHLSPSASLSDEAVGVIKGMLHDRMTEQIYVEPIQTFKTDVITKDITTVPIMKEGRKALEKINAEMGLGFDDFDLDYYTNLFKVGPFHSTT